MKRAALNRFRNRVDDTLRELLPATLRIGGELIEASTPGGRASSGFEIAGEDPDRRFTFRVPKSALAERLEIGAPIGWLIDGQELALEIEDAPYRPEENVWILTAKHRRT